MEGWIDGWMEGWKDGWKEGWMDGWMEGWRHILQWSDDNSRPLREVSASAAKGDKQDIKVIEYFRAQLVLFSRMCFYLGISILGRLQRGKNIIKNLYKKKPL